MGSSVLNSVIFLTCFFSHGSPLTKRIQQTIEERVNLGYNRCICVATVEEEGTHFYHAGEFPCKPSRSIFEIASLTKVFTAHLVFICQQQGLILIDDPIENYLPKGTHIPSFENQKITLRHLITHTSGLKDPSSVNYKNLKTGNIVKGAELTQNMLFSWLEEENLAFPPGTKTLYSNLGYALLGVILEQVSKKSYFSLLEKEILKPLGMKDTSIEIPNKRKHRQIVGTSNGEDAPYWKIPHLHAFGSLRSSSHDLALYLQYLLFDPIAKPARDFLCQPQLTITGTQTIVTLGLTLEKGHGEAIYAGGGRSIGFSCFLGFNLQKKLGILLLTDAPALDSLGLHLFNPQFPTATLKSVDTSAFHELKMYEGTYIHLSNPELVIDVQAGGKYLELKVAEEPSLKIFPYIKKEESMTRYFFSRHLDHANTHIEITLFLDDQAEMKIIEPEHTELIFKRFKNNASLAK